MQIKTKQLNGTKIKPRYKTDTDIENFLIGSSRLLHYRQTFWKFVTAFRFRSIKLFISVRLSGHTDPIYAAAEVESLLSALKPSGNKGINFVLRRERSDKHPSAATNKQFEVSISDSLRYNLNLSNDHLKLNVIVWHLRTELLLALRSNDFNESWPQWCLRSENVWDRDYLKKIYF